MEKEKIRIVLPSNEKENDALVESLQQALDFFEVSNKGSNEFTNAKKEKIKVYRLYLDNKKDFVSIEATSEEEAIRIFLNNIDYRKYLKPKIKFYSDAEKTKDDEEEKEINELFDYILNKLDKSDNHQQRKKILSDILLKIEEEEYLKRNK
jgi:hypothetical protein